MDYNYNDPEWQQDNSIQQERSSSYFTQYQQPDSRIELHEVTQRDENKFAVTTMVTGIVALIFFWFPIIPFLLGVVGMITAIISLLKEEHRVMAIVGMILSMISLTLTSLMTLGYVVEYLKYYG